MNETKIRELLANGKPVVFPPWRDRFDAAERASRTVQADWIKALVGADGTCSCQIEIQNAVIAGELVLRGRTFRRYVIFTNCDFEQRVIFNLAHFCLSLLVSRCAFKGDCEFRGAQIDGNCGFLLCAFQSSVTFADLAVNHTMNGSGTTFQGTNFERMTIGKSLRFRVRRDDKGVVVPVRFMKSARFLDSVVNGPAEFASVEFHDEANFIRMRVAGDVSFRAATKDDELREIDGVQPPVRFAGRAFFYRAQLNGDADFSGAIFEANASFRSAQIDGDLVMARGVRFEGEADFVQVRVGGKADFAGTQFAAFANFELANIGSIALFRSEIRQDGVTTFSGTAKFLGAVMRAADFQGVKFCEQANFSRLRVADDLQFSPLTAVAGSGELATKFEGNAAFFNAKIGGLFDFRGVEAKGTIELSGMSFGRLAADWRRLLMNQQPYNRQPYTEVEGSFRAAGDDREASEVFLERRRREYVEMRRKLARKQNESGAAWLVRSARALPDLMLELFQRHALRYGVRPLRLLVFSMIFVVLGSCVFAQAGAVTPKGALKPVTVELHKWEAFRYSLKLFVPGIDIPAGDWVPSAKMMPTFPVSFEAYGALHRFAGILLLPLGVAALAGLLVPKERGASK